MIDCNRFEPLRKLRSEVLAEVVREGERRLDAQLQMAAAADQRALTIAGFQITSATGALAGGIALAIKDKPDLWLSFLALGFATGMGLAAASAVHSVRPQKFNAPGNSPGGWLPDLWLGGHAHGHGLRQARIEQAACLDDAISDNRRIMDDSVSRLRDSIDWSLRVVMMAAALLIGTLVVRNVPSIKPVPATETGAAGSSKLLNGKSLDH